MSMSVHCDGCGLEYAGSKGLAGLFAQRSSVLRGRATWRMLAQVKYFHRRARALLASGDDDRRRCGSSWTRGRFTRYFTNHFMLPLVSAVWSCGFDGARGYPARYLFTFLDNHGMLTVTGSPQWRTVVGGSRTYVDRAAKKLVRGATPRRPSGRSPGTPTACEIRDDADELHRVDRVVVATHADQALRLLADPTRRRARGCSAPSSTCRRRPCCTPTARCCPRNPAARASWNYRMDSCASDDRRVKISYDLKLLQRIDRSTPTTSSR